MPLRCLRYGPYNRGFAVAHPPRLSRPVLYGGPQILGPYLPLSTRSLPSPHREKGTDVVTIGADSLLSFLPPLVGSDFTSHWQSQSQRTAKMSAPTVAGGTGA